MAITAATRTQLIGLSVAMLGQAPGTGRLNHWVADIDDDAMSVDDLANHIAESEAFQSEYPAFLTSMEFAEAFLGNVLYGLDDAAMTAAVELVSGMLDSGLSRGSLALAVVDALHDIAMQGMDHPAYDGLGMSAMVMYNKVHVASHYTLDARMEEPSSDVLANVTADADSAAMAIDAIDNPPAPPMEPEMGQRFVLTPTIDDFTGGSLDDTFVAQPLQGADGLFNATLNSFDSIDGGDGTDTIHVFGVKPNDTLRLGAEDIMNVENVVISTVGSIDADLSDWAGLEMVSLDRFGREDETMVEVIVDGAMVSSERAFDGNVTIVGASGTVDIEAGAGSVVHVGSAGHTGSVMVKGGASVAVNNGAGKNSKTVTSVSVDGVRPAASTKTMVDGFKAKVDSSGFLVDQAGLRRVTVDIDSTLDTATNPADPITSIKLGDESEGLRPLLNGEDGEAIEVVLANAVDDDPVDKQPLVFDTTTGLVRLQDGRALPSGISVTFTPTAGPGKDATQTTVTTPGSGATVKVHSDAIETVALHNSTAVALIHNNSKTEDGDDMPEDLAVTVNKYGTFQPWGAVKVAGKLCLGGAGSAENIDIMVAGASAFDLASGKVKTLDISGEGRLVLGVDNFKEDDDPSNDGVSKTLETVTASGAVNLSMTGLSGMSKLKMIDASESSGNNTFRSQAGRAPADSDQLSALTMVMGGSGKDSVTLRTSVTGKLESVDTGDGDDTVTITGMLRNDGLMVNLGAGNDIYSGRESNSESRVDGGDGIDVLHLTSAENSTYKDADGETHSIYTGFETLNVAFGGGDYDIEQLGIVNDVLVTANSPVGSEVTLENMGDGMGIRVSGAQGRGDGRSSDTKITINHDLAERKSGEARASGELDVTLTALGRNDTRGDTKGEAILMLTTDDDIEVINVNSSASPHSHGDTPARDQARASHYENEITLTSSTVEELIVDGNAKLTIMMGSTLAALELVDAQNNSGGVTFDASGLGQELELVGGSGVDVLTGSSGENEITGGLGGDTLRGGTDDDVFIIDSAAESMARFAIIGGVNTLLGGYDKIVGFNPLQDKIDLSRGLLNAITGNIKDSVAPEDGDWNDWMYVDRDDDEVIDSQEFISSIDGNDDATDGGAKNLATFIGDGNGLFESKEPPVGALDTDVGATDRTVKYSIAVVQQDVDDNAEDGLWLLFDVDGNGDYDAGTDMVIFLAGTTTPGEFVEANARDGDEIFI